jgi:biopolymer transport protein ExbB
MTLLRFRNGLSLSAVFALGIAFAAIAFSAWAQGPLQLGGGPILAQLEGSQPSGPAPVITAPAPAAAADPSALAGRDQPPPFNGNQSSSAAAARAGSPSVASAALPRDLSLWGMFLNADIVVKIVMVGLVFASLVSWTVWLAKNFEMWRAKGQARAAIGVLVEARTLAEANARLSGSSDAVARLVRTAVHEVQSSSHDDPEALKERVSWLLDRIEAAAGRRIGRGMGLLASIGATAPFVGLFGTVWGIMNSFIGISNAHTTNLAVVAPGIAEALLATALGLFAAIPAVVIYNAFARSIGGYRALLGDSSALVMRLVSRDCERAASVAMSRAAE